MTSKKEVAKAKATEVAQEVISWEGMAGEGLENVTKDDVLIPRLAILQGLSPQLKKSKAEYIPGAVAGDICDLGTGQNFGDKVTIVPVHYSKVWIEWAPRETGQGLVEIHKTEDALDDCVKNEKGKMVNPAGNIIEETAQFYCLNLDADCQMCFLSFASTQLKKARLLNTLAMHTKLHRADGSKYTPPLFYQTFELGVAEEGNNKGEWIGWTVAKGVPISTLENGKEIFDYAVNFRRQIKAGEVKADVSSGGGQEAGGETPM